MRHCFECDEGREPVLQILIVFMLVSALLGRINFNGYSGFPRAEVHDHH